MGRVITELADELDRLHQRRDALAAEIEEAFRAHPFGQLPRTGARILAENGDGSRFASGSKLASYGGVAPVTRQSGSSLRSEAKSRRGNHRLKNAMFIAAFASLPSPRLEGLLRPQASRGQEAQRRGHLPRRRRCDVILARLRNYEPYRHPITTRSRTSNRRLTLAKIMGAPPG